MGFDTLPKVYQLNLKDFFDTRKQYRLQLYIGIYLNSNIK